MARDSALIFSKSIPWVFFTAKTGAALVGYVFGRLERGQHYNKSILESFVLT